MHSLVQMPSVHQTLYGYDSEQLKLIANLLQKENLPPERVADALMDIGNGWEPYEGCTRNLLMILEDPDTTIQIVGEDSDYYKAGVRRYHITLPEWWRKGVIAVSFEESELV